jgi:hypothetical protein
MAFGHLARVSTIVYLYVGILDFDLLSTLPLLPSFRWNRESVQKGQYNDFNATCPGMVYFLLQALIMVALSIPFYGWWCESLLNEVVHGS